MRRLHFSRPINWVFNPAAAIVAGTLSEEQVIYHCVDEYSAFTGVDATALRNLEQQLLRKASLVIVSADRLFSPRAAMNPRTVVVKHGVDFSHFRRALEPATTPPADISALPKPILGFFGLVADWIDIELLAETAKRFAKGSLVIVGKITTDVSALRDLPNVHLLGQKAYSELPGYCKAFDVALMPFKINELTLNANPLKVREYLAAGLPVVSTQIPEVAAIGLCSIASDLDSFEREIRTALKDPGPSEMRSQAIAHESWEQRVHEIKEHFRSVSEGLRFTPNVTN
jgi:glycosyltransferase involved in cell wall biosynthesis